MSRIRSGLAALAVVALLAVSAAPAAAQGQTIKIGILYDHSGPFSAAGSLNCWRGAKMMIDYINEKGGVLGKYKIVQVDGDSQSKAEVAINEAERLLNVEKVDILAGVYSSAHAVPLAEKVDKQKKFLWITTAIADAVLKDRNLQYTFRPQPNGSLFGVNSRGLHRRLRAGAAEEGGQGPAHRHHLRGRALRRRAWPRPTSPRRKKQGMQIVLKEGYSAQAADLSSLVTKLRAARPDVLFHTGYNPDINLFLRQAKEQGLRVRAYIGHGAGHSQLDKLKEAFGNEVEGFHTVDPPASQLIDAKKLKPGVGELTQEMVKRYKAFEPNVPVNNIAPARLDGLQQHVDPAQRRAAARHPEARRLRAGSARQGGPRDRHPRGRHHAGLRREVPRRGQRHARPERARHRRRVPGRRGQVPARLAQGRRDAERAGAAARLVPLGVTLT